MHSSSICVLCGGEKEELQLLVSITNLLLPTHKPNVKIVPEIWFSNIHSLIQHSSQLADTSTCRCTDCLDLAKRSLPLSCFRSDLTCSFHCEFSEQVCCSVGIWKRGADYPLPPIHMRQCYKANITLLTLGQRIKMLNQELKIVLCCYSAGLLFQKDAQLRYDFEPSL